MTTKFFETLEIAARTMSYDEEELRESTNNLRRLFDNMKIPFTTDTLKAFRSGIDLMHTEPSRWFYVHMISRLRAIIRQREEVEARANV